MKDTADFLDKLKDFRWDIKGAVLVNADVVELYSTIPIIEVLAVLRKLFEEFLYNKKVPTEEII